MFATFRKEARDGEIVCISNTNQPPLSGTQVNHFACDRCRAKKMKCSAHRFGCERCRDRNVTCTYSTSPQINRREKRKFSMSKSVALRSASNGGGSLRTGEASAANFGGVSQRVQPSNSAEDGERPGEITALTPPQTDPGIQEEEALGPEDGPLSSDTHSINALHTSTSVSSPDLTLLDTIMSDMSAYDMQYPSLDLDTLDVSADPFTDDILSALTEDGNPETNTLQDEIDWNVESFQPDEKRKTGNGRCTFPLDSESQLHKERAVCSYAEMRTAATATPAGAVGRVRETPNSLANATVSCQCIDIILSVLEQAQNHSKVTGLKVAEQSLYFVKGALTRCKSTTRCKSCWDDSRVITFSILLFEKTMSILEDISQSWEINLLAATSDRKDSLMIEDSQPLTGDTFLLHGYRIDSMQEHCEIFGFLIVLQVKQLATFSKIANNRVRSQQGEKHKGALKAVILRIQELHRGLSETLGVLHVK